jgi:hypothetical protein
LVFGYFLNSVNFVSNVSSLSVCESFILLSINLLSPTLESYFIN